MATNRQAQAGTTSRRLFMVAGLGLAGALLLGTLAFTAGDAPVSVRQVSLPSGILVDAASPLPPPPAEGSAEHAEEVTKLLMLQSSRSKEQEADATYWASGAVLRWNEIARGLVARHNTNPVVASRLYALLSVAQHDALVAAVAQHRVFQRPPPSESDSPVVPLFAAEVESTYPSDHAAVAAASAAILAFVYPAKAEVAEVMARAREHEESRLRAGISYPSDVAAGDTLGREVAARIIEQAKTDGAKTAGVNWRGEIPVGRDKWVSAEYPPTTPVRPLWGKVRPWLMERGDQFRPAPPPAIDSDAFKQAVGEVKQISLSRTPEQTRIALLWADAQASATPPGHWNQIAADLVAEHPGGELAAARVLAFLNMAMMDAGIACWDAKYTYWLLRPTQADPTISIPVGLPNFPSYPSGHSTFSGAAAPVLGHFFPDQAEKLTEMANEASMSRVYGGIHYRFDGEVGLAVGGKVAALAIAREQTTAGD